MKQLLLLVVLLMGSYSFGSIDCPANYPSGKTLLRSDGSMDYPNGRTLRRSDGSMDYPNGRTLRRSDGSMDYQSGRTLRRTDRSMDYPNGRTLRRSDGSMDDPNGSTNTTGSVSLNTEFDNSQMRIVVRLNSARFQTTLDYGNGILILDFDDIGNVSCTVEGGNGPSEFRVDGNRGSAYVTVKQGQDPKAVKDAVQKALDGF